MSKFLIIYFIFLNLYFVSAMSIDEQISRIKKAPPKERVELMNKFKQNLASMNQNQRNDAIETLRTKMNVKNSMHNESKTIQLVPQMQMRENEHMSSYQNINNMKKMNQSKNHMQMPSTNQKQIDMQRR